MRRTIVASLLALGSVSVSVGCDKIISSDVTETPFDLPSKSYSFDSAAFPIPAGITSEVPCGDGQPIVVCCDPPAGLPRPDCSTTSLECQQNENGMSVCTATVTVTQSQMLNFAQEAPELKSLPSVINIKIKRISYAVTTNTLNIDLPDVELFLGPSGATKPSDSGVVKFGTMPGILAGTTPAGDVALVRDAESVLGMFTHDLTAPISFIASTTLTVTHSPTGRIDLTVSGKLAASL
jgi:hypothetical protein